MFENEEEVMENITENADAAAEETVSQDGEVAPVQQPAAEPEKVYSEEEFKAALGAAMDKKARRLEAKVRKEYESQYGELVNVLRAGTGKNDVAEVTSEFRQYYEGRGVKIPNAPAYSERETEILAKADVDDIIESGMEEVIGETDRLARIGVDNMSPRERAVFRKLAEYRKNVERGNELAKIGVTEDVYNSKEFRSFSAKFGSDTPVTEIYEIFSKMQPKKEIKPMGSMKSAPGGKETVKDFYTFEEASKFTKQDFDKNPELLKAVERSMQKW